MAKYMLTSVKFTHCHNICFIWLPENIRKILVKNANISWSKIFLISSRHAKKDAEFRLWLLFLSIFSHVCFIRGMLLHTTFFSSLWGFSTGVEMTERELDQIFDATFYRTQPQYFFTLDKGLFSAALGVMTWQSKKWKPVHRTRGVI